MILVDYPLQPAAQDKLNAAGIEWIASPDPRRSPVADYVGTLAPDVRAGIDIMLGDAFKANRELLALLPNLRWIHHFAAGLSDKRSLDWDLLNGRHIAVSTSKIQSVSVSELAVAMLLALAKRLPGIMDAQQHHCYDTDIMPSMLSGKTALIVGTGNIGREIGRKLTMGFNMHVAGINEDGSPIPCFSETARMDQLDVMIDRVDAVILACPLTDATRGMMNRARIARMKPGAYFVNVARGQLVDQDALVDALNQGAIAGAACDVFANEPPNQDDAVWTARNLLITPHIAGSNPDYSINLVDAFIKNLPFYLEGRKTEMPNYANVNRY